MATFLSIRRQRALIVAGMAIMAVLLVMGIIRKFLIRKTMAISTILTSPAWRLRRVILAV